MCDMAFEREDSPCAPEDGGTYRRGDLLLCADHAKLFPWNVGRVEGEERCPVCFGFRPKGTKCGEPCGY